MNLICKVNKATRSPEISRQQVQKLAPQFFSLYIDSHCPYYYYLGKPPSSYLHVKIPYMYIYDLEKPPAI